MIDWLQGYIRTSVVISGPRSFRLSAALAALLAACAGCSRPAGQGTAASAGEKVLNVYNWSDYIQPSDPIVGSAHDLPFGLPRSLDEALRELRDCEPLVKLLGEPFVEAFTIVKEAEYEVFLQVISSWEREHLLLNV